METVSQNSSVMKKLTYGVCTLALMAAISMPLTKAYGADANPVARHANKQIEQKSQDVTAEKRKEITSEAQEALNETRNALRALDAGKKEDALSALERATGKLDIILAREPSLSLAPTTVSTVTNDIYGSVDAIKDARKLALDLLEDGRVQDARWILKNLASENVIYVDNIPLASYPLAIKLAVKNIDDGKIDAAKNVLQTALNTLVVTQTVVPLHVVRAQALLKDAETIAEKKDRKPDENKRLSELLTVAQHEVEMAEVLGYGTKKDFKSFYEQISQIEDKTSNGKSGFGFFEKIKSSMISMLDDSKHAAQGKSTSPIKVNN